MNRIIVLAVLLFVIPGIFIPLQARSNTPGTETAGTRQFAGIGYSVSFLSQDGASSLTYRYEMLTRHPRGLSFDYLLLPGHFGIHVQARFTNYEYAYYENDDPRLPHYYLDQATTHYHITMMSTDFSAEYVSKGDRVAATIELGGEINQNVKGDGFRISEKTVLVDDGNGQYHYTTTRYGEQRKNWEKFPHFQYLLRIGIMGRLTEWLSYAANVRFLFYARYNFVPIGYHGTMATINFSLYYRFGKAE